VKYNDPKHIETFLTERRFPAIHDDMADLFLMVTRENGMKPVLDLGSGLGLLSKRMKIICPEVVGVEGSKKLIEQSRRLSEKGLTFVNMSVTKETLKPLRGLISQFGIKYVVARRVFPEISDKGGVEFIGRLAQLFYHSGIEGIFLEGRKENTRSKHELKNADKEVQALSKYYELVGGYYDCRYLKRRGNE
jgi:hypothetical protein